MALAALIDPYRTAGASAARSLHGLSCVGEAHRYPLHCLLASISTSVSAPTTIKITVAIVNPSKINKILLFIIIPDLWHDIMRLISHCVNCSATDTRNPALECAGPISAVGRIGTGSPSRTRSRISPSDKTTATKAPSEIKASRQEDCEIRARCPSAARCSDHTKSSPQRQLALPRPSYNKRKRGYWEAAWQHKDEYEGALAKEARPKRGRCASQPCCVNFTR